MNFDEDEKKSNGDYIYMYQLLTFYVLCRYRLNSMWNSPKNYGKLKF